MIRLPEPSKSAGLFCTRNLRFAKSARMTARAMLTAMMIVGERGRSYIAAIPTSNNIDLNKRQSQNRVLGCMGGESESTGILGLAAPLTV